MTDERLTTEQLRLIVQGLGSEFAHRYPYAMARELLAARERIAELEAENAALRGEYEHHTITITSEMDIRDDGGPVSRGALYTLHRDEHGNVEHKEIND